MESLAKSGGGWRLRPDWTPASTSAKDVLAEALNADLKDIGDPVLGDLVSAAAESGGGAQRAFVVPSSGGLVLQISKIRNVSAPKANEESATAPRMLKLSLTDGHAVVQGVEVTKLEKLSMATPPGTKVRLRAGCQIPYVNGFLQMTPQCLEVLGGRVEPLVEKWEISRKLAQFTRAKPVDVGGPPSWIPFGKRIAAGAQTLPEVDKNFKALGIGDKQQESKESAEFDSQRQGAIDEAAKQGGKKVFGGGKAEIKEASAGHQRRGYQRSANNAPTDGDAKRSSVPLDDGGDDAPRGGGGRRGRGGRGRRNGEDGGDDSYGHAKPTSGVSLFDFLEKEFPGAHDVEKKTKSSNDTTHQDASYPSTTRRRDDHNSNSHRSTHGGDSFDRGGESRRGQQDHQRRSGRGGDGEGRNEHSGRGSHRGGGGGGGSVAHNYGSGGGGGGRSDRYQSEVGKKPQEEGSNRRQPDHNRRENAPRFQPNSGAQRASGNYHQSDDAGNNRRGGDGKRGAPASGERGDRGRGGRGAGPGGERSAGGERSGGGGGGERGDKGKSAKQQTSDRDFGEWSNSTYHDSAAQRHQQPRPQQQQQQHHDNVSAGFGGMHLNDVDQRRQQQQPQKFQRPPKAPQQPVGSNAQQEQQQQQQLQFQKPPPQIYQKPNVIQWKEGATCLAKYWEDGRFYTSRITAVTPNTAVVLFLEFGNHEEVLLSDLKPITATSMSGGSMPQTGGGGRGGPFIPATPGLPPAFPQS